MRRFTAYVAMWEQEYHSCNVNLTTTTSNYVLGMIAMRRKSKPHKLAPLYQRSLHNCRLLLLGLSLDNLKLAVTLRVKCVFQFHLVQYDKHHMLKLF